MFIYLFYFSATQFAIRMGFKEESLSSNESMYINKKMFYFQIENFYMRKGRIFPNFSVLYSECRYLSCMSGKVEYLFFFGK